MFVWEYSYMYIYNLYDPSDYRNYAATQSKAWGNTTFVEVEEPLSLDNIEKQYKGLSYMCFVIAWKSTKGDINSNEW